MQNYNSEKRGFGGILLGSVKVKALSILSLFLLIGCALSTQDLGAKIDLEMKCAAASETQMFAGCLVTSRPRRKKSGPIEKLDVNAGRKLHTFQPQLTKNGAPVG